MSGGGWDEAEAKGLGSCVYRECVVIQELRTKRRR